MATDDYIVSGRFRDDIQSWFASVERATCKPLLDANAFAVRLSESARAPFEKLTAMIMNGELPSMTHFGITSDWTFGVDLAANGRKASFEGVDVLGEIFPLAADGGGNLFVQLLDGRVGIWNHEVSCVEDDTLFASLNDCVWILVRVEAVENEALDGHAVMSELATFGANTGAAYYRNWLREYLADH